MVAIVGTAMPARADDAADVHTASAAAAMAEGRYTDAAAEYGAAYASTGDPQTEADPVEATRADTQVRIDACEPEVAVAAAPPRRRAPVAQTVDTEALPGDEASSAPAPAPAPVDDTVEDPWAIAWQGAVVRLGVVHTPGPRAASGTLIGLGYRIETQRAAFDLSMAADNAEPSDPSWYGGFGGGWSTRDRVAVRASYLVRLESALLSFGGGLGLGINRLYARESNGEQIVAVTEDAGHAELRAGVTLGRAPAIGVDVGLRLPLSELEAPQSPAWWPTFDVAITIGAGLPK